MNDRKFLHDLSNPLTAVRGQVKMLQSRVKKLDTAKQEMLTDLRIHSSLDKMLVNLEVLQQLVSEKKNEIARMEQAEHKPAS